MSDFKAKMHPIPLELSPRPCWGSLYSAPPDLLAVFKWPTTKGRGGKGRGEEEGKVKGREEERRWREGFSIFAHTIILAWCPYMFYIHLDRIMQSTMSPERRRDAKGAGKRNFGGLEL